MNEDIAVFPAQDRDSRHYWSALADGRFEIQQCGDCGRWTWPPLPICASCQGDRLQWRVVSGWGHVYSWVKTHHVYLRAFARLVPYTIVLVRIDEQEDIWIPGRLISDGEARQGLRVHAAPERLNDKVGLINWRVA